MYGVCHHDSTAGNSIRGTLYRTMEQSKVHQALSIGSTVHQALYLTQYSAASADLQSKGRPAATSADSLCSGSSSSCRQPPKPITEAASSIVSAMSTLVWGARAGRTCM